MKVLVIGAGGLLGSNVVMRALEHEISVEGTFHTERPAVDVPLFQLDLGDSESARTLLDSRNPDAVINCAAMTNVDECETNRDEAYEVNGHAPGQLAEHCGEMDIHFTHISTDYVFDGTSETPYEEDAETNPIQVYGESKFIGEQRVREADADSLIVRLSFLWGVHRGSNTVTGFPAWVRDRLRTGEPTPLFTDQHVTPTRAGAAVSALLELTERESSGLFHIASRSCVTPYAFGQEICELLSANSELLETSTQADVERPAARPKYTCLDVAEIETTLGRKQPTVAEDLDAVSAAIL